MYNISALFQESEVRLFDKGEMNTYRDELSFAQAVAGHTSTLLADLQADMEPSILKELTKCHETLKEHLPKMDNFTVKSIFLQEADSDQLRMTLSRQRLLIKALLPHVGKKHEIIPKLESEIHLLDSLREMSFIM